MKTLDGQTIFTYMTNLSDKFIEEAAYPLPASHEPTSVKPSWWQKAGHLVNSPVGVALICGVVSLGILAGIVIAGRNAPPTPPAGGTVSADTAVESEILGEESMGQQTPSESTPRETIPLTPVEDRISSIRLGGRDIALSYYGVVKEDYKDFYLDRYLDANGLEYLFHKGTGKLYNVKNRDIQQGSPNGSTEITMEEARKIADDVLINYGIIPDLSRYNIDEGGSAQNGYHFSYKYQIGDVDTWYTFMISVNRHGDIYSVFSNYWSQNLPYITDADIEAAKERFLEKYPQFTGFSIYPYEGMLSVVYEDIVHTHPESTETNEDGEIIIEHEHKHVFYTEVITPTTP